MPANGMGKDVSNVVQISQMANTSLPCSLSRPAISGPTIVLWIQDQSIVSQQEQIL